MRAFLPDVKKHNNYKNTVSVLLRYCRIRVLYRANSAGICGLRNLRDIAMTSNALVLRRKRAQYMLVFAAIYKDEMLGTRNQLWH